MDQDFSAFKNSAQAERNFPVDEDRWRALRARLDQAARSRQRSWLPWLAVAILLLLFSGLLFTRRELQRVRGHHDELLLRLDSLDQRQVATLPAVCPPLRDTVYRYRERLVYRWLPHPTWPRTPPAFTPPTTATLFADYQSSLPAIGQLRAASPVEAQRSSARTAPPLLSTRSTLQPPSRPVSMPALQPTIAAYRPPALTRLLRSARPGRLAVGLTAGLGRPADHGQHETRRSSSSLVLALPFGRSLALLGTVGVSRLDYDLRQFNSDLGVLPLSPPAEGFNFTDAQVRIPALQWGMGARYTFRPQSTWQPYAQLTYGQSFLQAYQTEYAFKQGAAEIPVEVERQFDHDRIAYWQPALGMRYRLAKRPWRLGLSSSLWWPQTDHALPLRALMVDAQIEYTF